jgi:hypothetical protein
MQVKYIAGKRSIHANKSGCLSNTNDSHERWDPVVGQGKHDCSASEEAAHSTDPAG